MTTYAAGILPIAFKGNVCHFLVGRDIRGIGVADFGGKSEKRLDFGVVTNTASREFYEETLGVSLTAEQIRRRLTPETSVVVKGSTQNGNVYTMFIVEVPFDPGISRNFQRTASFLRTKGLHRPLVEKIDVSWVDFDEMMDIEKRSVFERTLMENFDTISRIGRSSPATWKDLLKKNIP
jgi:hypothetical protein